jgi:hypothetical protein
MKENLLKRVLANVVDFDMHNLFPGNTPMEELEDASQGTYDVNAPGSLKGRNYDPPQSMPLVVLPKYQGDFLDRLRNPIQGKPVEAEESLLDFSMPSEMLKHQEQPVPRILLDDFYEYSRPGDGAGLQDLQEYWDRSWDGQAPEISEDLIERMDGEHGASRVACDFLHQFCLSDAGSTPHVQPSTVVARYLMDRFPIKAQLDTRKAKTAAKLRDIEKSQLYSSKTNSYKNLNTGGVTVRIVKKEPRLARWTFLTGSGRDTYTTIFQFKPEGAEPDVNKLEVFVSCNCLSWLYWGAQYNAFMKDYLYGPVSIKFKTPPGHQPKLSRPVIRDPRNKFLVCKHVLACLPLVTSYKLTSVPVKFKAPKVEIDKETLPKKPTPMPGELKNFGRQPEIRELEKRWERMSPKERKEAIDGLDSPGAVAYIGHKFLDTASDFVLERLKNMALKSSLPSARSWAKKLLRFWLGGMS